MKIAICFSGQVRTGIHAAPNIKRFIGELWDSCDFFIHTWDLSHEKPDPTQVKEYGGYSYDNKQEIDFEKFKEIYNFKKIEITPFYDENNIPSCAGDSWQWWSWLFSIKLKQHYEIENSIKYDYVIKIRTDIIYKESLSISDIINNTSTNSVSVMEEFMGPYGYMVVDDVFYLADSPTMDLIVSFVNNIPNIITDKSPHHLLYKHITSNNIKINNLNNGYFSGKYAVLRQKCISFCTLTEFEKCEKMDKQIYYPNIGIIQ